MKGLAATSRCLDHIAPKERIDAMRAREWKQAART